MDVTKWQLIIVSPFETKTSVIIQPIYRLGYLQCKQAGTRKYIFSDKNVIGDYYFPYVGFPNDLVFA